jgi:maleate isomerase
MQQNSPEAVEMSELKYVLDGGVGTRAHIGMVVLDNDQTLPSEARHMLNLPGVALYESRVSTQIDSRKPLTPEVLQGVFEGLDLAVRQINTRRPSDVVALGCTSAAMVIGPDELQRRVRQAHPKAKVTNPFSAILAALRALGAARVAYICPYHRDVAQNMVSQIESAGYVVPAKGTFYGGSFITEDAPYVSPGSISKAVFSMAESTDIDTVIVACTQMRIADEIQRLEDLTSKAVISSNSALAWHALRLAGVDDAVPGWGRLFEKTL